MSDVITHGGRLRAALVRIRGGAMNARKSLKTPLEFQVALEAIEEIADAALRKDEPPEAA